ncbi:MAG: alkaline shock response membrane anchor protein AmaP [Actinomycetota bacterium]|nr:alkaline shock response membrane anchor protein AmaP [Actinomycetota bacterium]
MRRGPDRLNNVVLTLLALVLLGVGAYGLARGYGAFGDDQAAEPVLGDDLREFVTTNANWFWPIAAVASLLVAWLGLRWLLAQVTAPTVTRLRVPSEGPGRTELLASGAAAALAQDIEEYPGVKGARARIVGDDPAPEVEIIVDVHEDADVPALRRRIEEHALERFRTALDLQQLRPRVHIRLAERAGRAVR